MSSESCPNQDQLILAQKEQLDEAIASSHALVGRLESTVCLEADYASDESFLSKAKSLKETYSGLRRTRPDGNCFFRAVAFRYLEVLSKNKQEAQQFRARIEPTKDRMVKLGFPQFTVEDFYDNFLDLIDKTGSDDFDLYETMNDQGLSDYAVVFLRLLTSMHLQENKEFFQNFLDNDKTLEEFCSTEVEPMYVECDNVQVMALTAVTGIKTRIMYLDRGVNEKPSSHDFPEDTTPSIHLLYRPGHYDVLYERE